MLSNTPEILTSVSGFISEIILFPAKANFDEPRCGTTISSLNFELSSSTIKLSILDTVIFSFFSIDIDTEIPEYLPEVPSEDTILRVENLHVSFRTPNGLVRAVRGVNFDLKKGETLCIVGESGSGKSVTSKAIMGILAGNSIVEGGEILYDGQDLLKISEDYFHEIRGDKISMIFQDPMSSLNPIMKIGKQLTEALILNLKLMIKNIINQVHV